ncbi:hypothetical protein [Rhizobium laguerreae]|uniref:hypothetical protein n=1 Tax=Rhizobium laguerreae TaxID=1076926 RepID=UPI0021B0D35C|nr:hypothetical protein [Rhizobium laguerreae]
MGILLISNVQDNIPIHWLLDSFVGWEQKENICILLDMMSTANTTLKRAVNDDCCP